MKNLICISLISLILFSCRKNSESNNSFNYQYESMNDDENYELEDYLNNEENIIEQEIFDCDNLELTESIEKRFGKLQNIMTVNRNDELKICECEAHSARYQIPHTATYTNGKPYIAYYNGGMVKYKAQLKNNGEIVWSIGPLNSYR